MTMIQRRPFAAAAICALLAAASTLPNLAAAAVGGPAATARPAIHSTRIVLLGTAGGPVARKFRSQPATLLIVDGRPYLIDAGEGVVRQLAWAGVTPAQIAAIFFTHHHLDHDAGLEPLMGFIWSERNLERHAAKSPAAPVQIYGPAATKFLVRTSLDFLSVSERTFNSHGVIMPLPARTMFAAHDITHDGLVYQDDLIRVTAAENTHYHNLPGTAAYLAGDKSFSYRFDTPARSVVFTGDTGPCAAVTRLAQGADVLVSEVISEKFVEQLTRAIPGQAKKREALAFHMLNEHLIPEEIGKMAEKAHVGAVILTHIVPGLDSETDATAYTAGVRKYYSGPVIAGRDLLEY